MIFTFFYLYDSLGVFLILYFFYRYFGADNLRYFQFYIAYNFFNQLYDYSSDFNVRQSAGRHSLWQNFLNTAENFLEIRISYKKTDSGFPEPVP